MSDTWGDSNTYSAFLTSQNYDNTTNLCRMLSDVMPDSKVSTNDNNTVSADEEDNCSKNRDFSLSSLSLPRIYPKF